MHKKALLALLLVMAMALSGCTLIEKDLEVDRATEVIRVGDTVYTKGQIQDETQYQLNYMAYYYSMFGMNYDTTSAQAIADAQQSGKQFYRKRIIRGVRCGCCAGGLGVRAGIGAGIVLCVRLSGGVLVAAASGQQQGAQRQCG